MQKHSSLALRRTKMECTRYHYGLIFALVFGFAFGSSQWPGEPAGSTQLLDWAFNSVEVNVPFRSGIVWGNYGAGRITTDATAPVSPSKVLVSTISPGSSTGGSEIHYLLPQTYNELFVGLMWRTNPQFEGRPVGNKLFFVKGPGTNGVFLFNSSALANGKGQLIWGANTGGINNSHACGGDAYGALCFPNIGSGTLSTGVWTRLEAYVKASTTATSKDGIVRWWVNGALAGNYTNLNYPGPLNEWMWSETWDGYVNPVPTVEWDHYVDHLYISAPNCGAGGCPAPAYLVITSSLTSARTGTPYSATLAASGGTKPYTWFLDSGNLPPGLSLNSSGVISGTPTCVGRSDFTIRVTDASTPALTATKSYTIITSGTSTSCPSSITSESKTRTGQAQFSAKAVSGKVTFNLPVSSSAQYRLSVYDLTGKKAYEHASMGQKEISIAKTLKTGVYVAKFTQGAQVSSLRFQVID